MEGEQQYSKDDVIDELTSQLSQLQTSNLKSNSVIAGSSYAQNKDVNLIQHQLETADIMDRLEHSYKGDQIKVDELGNEHWETPTDKDLILFNDYGVNSMFSIIGLYFNRNTILSQYDDMRINEILGDLGHAIRIFILCNYEKMGMDTEFKKTRYPLVVLNTIHAIESVYRRAIHFRTADTLNTSKILTQHDSLGANSMMNPMMSKKKWSLFNRKTW